MFLFAVQCDNSNGKEVFKEHIYKCVPQQNMPHRSCFCWKSVSLWCMMRHCQCENLGNFPNFFSVCVASTRNA